MAYEALKSFKLLQLPGISMLQDYKDKLVCEPGMLDHTNIHAFVNFIHRHD